MRRALVLILLALLAISVVSAQEQPLPGYVILEGFAFLPADTFTEGPGVGSQINPADNLNGRTLPFEGQPVQGFSATIPAPNGNFYALSDNGFGARANSGDYNLAFYELAVDFETGTVEVIGSVQLRDPNNLAGFPIVNEDTDERFLTGADFDTESFRIAPDGTFWIGEEFGPYLLHFSADGELLAAPFPTPYPDVLADAARGLDFVQSPQNPAFVDLADDAARRAAANLGGSRGFEGMAISPDGTTLYTMLEGGLLDDATPGRLLIQPFDIASMSYTGEFFFYPLSIPTNAIGELTAINDTQFLVIERDNNQGVNSAFKRVFLIDLNMVGEDGVTLSKTLVADLLAIYDANGLTTAAEGVVGFGPIFRFPFQTIESVYPIDADTLLLVSDNNYPFSNGRRPGVPDDNEFILITLPTPLDLP